MRQKHDQQIFYWNLNVNKVKCLEEADKMESESDEEDDFEAKVEEPRW